MMSGKVLRRMAVTFLENQNLISEEHRSPEAEKAIKGCIALQKKCNYSEISGILDELDLRGYSVDQRLALLRAGLDEKSVLWSKWHKTCQRLDLWFEKFKGREDLIRDITARKYQLLEAEPETSIRKWNNYKQKLGITDKEIQDMYYYNPDLALMNIETANAKIEVLGLIEKESGVLGFAYDTFMEAATILKNGAPLLYAMWEFLRNDTNELTNQALTSEYLRGLLQIRELEKKYSESKEWDEKEFHSFRSYLCHKYPYSGATINASYNQTYSDEWMSRKQEWLTEKGLLTHTQIRQTLNRAHNILPKTNRELEAIYNQLAAVSKEREHLRYVLINFNEFCRESNRIGDFIKLYTCIEKSGLAGFAKAMLFSDIVLHTELEPELVYARFCFLSDNCRGITVSSNGALFFRRKKFENEYKITTQELLERYPCKNGEFPPIKSNVTPEQIERFVVNFYVENGLDDQQAKLLYEAYGNIFGIKPSRLIDINNVRATFEALKKHGFKNEMFKIFMHNKSVLLSDGNPLEWKLNILDAVEEKSGLPRLKEACLSNKNKLAAVNDSVYARCMFIKEHIPHKLTSNFFLFLHKSKFDELVKKEMGEMFAKDITNDYLLKTYPLPRELKDDLKRPLRWGGKTERGNKRTPKLTPIQKLLIIAEKHELVDVVLAQPQGWVKRLTLMDDLEWRLNILEAIENVSGVGGYKKECFSSGELSKVNTLGYLRCLYVRDNCPEKMNKKVLKALFNGEDFDRVVGVKHAALSYDTNLEERYELPSHLVAPCLSPEFLQASR